MKKNTVPFYSKKKFIRNQSIAIAEECLSFMDGERHGNVSIGIEDNATCRNIRSNQFKNIFGEVPKSFRAAA